MRSLFLLSIIAAALHAVTLSGLIESARTKHPTLEAIKSRIAAADYAIKRAKNFDNPVIGLGINDIRLDEPANRSLERMQTQSVSFSQKIPWFGKRDAKKAIKKAEKELLFASLKEAEAVLFAKIKQTAYRLWETQKLIELTQQTISLTKQNIELFEAYTASSRSGNTHMGIMSAELVKSRLKTSLKRLIAKKEQDLALLEYLSFQDNIKEVEVELFDKKLLPLEKLLSKIENSPIITIEEAKEKIVIKHIELDRLQEKIDPVIRVGYYQRSSYEDYISMGVGFAIPIYGTEKNIVQERRAALLSQKKVLLDSKREVRAKIEKLFAKAKSSHEIVEIIEKESIPQIDHMFDLIRSNIAAGGDLYKFIDLVEQKLKLDAEAISARAKYYITLAEIEAILGEKI